MNAGMSHRKTRIERPLADHMDVVERVLVYTELTPEGAIETPNDPPPSWPEQGAIQFNDTKLAYREGLPLVLKGTSFNVKPGEKVRHPLPLCYFLD